MRHHRVKISVGVEQVVAVLDAEGADDEAGGLADGDAQSAQVPVIFGGGDG